MTNRCFQLPPRHSRRIALLVLLAIGCSDGLERRRQTLAVGVEREDGGLGVGADEGYDAAPASGAVFLY